jgi:hypothetical protein
MIVQLGVDKTITTIYQKHMYISLSAPWNQPRGCTVKWPCDTSSENSSKSKTTTVIKMTMLKLVKIQSLRKISLLLMK